MINTKRIYLDWAAATPLLPEAKAAMEPFLGEEYGNPSAVHAEGRRARAAVEAARARLGAALQVKPEFVTFTGGGTEGNNLAIFGIIDALNRDGRAYSDMAVLTTCIEHPSIGVAMNELERRGVEVRYVAVDEAGKIVLPDVAAKLDEKVVLVSCAYANSEIGTVQPLHAIKKALHAAEQQSGTQIYFHIDAAQAPLWLNCQFDSTGADMLVLDAAKCGGPKGSGALIQSRRVTLAPTIFGGGQERGLRPGTENVANIVGASVALDIAQASWREQAEQVRAVRDAGLVTLRELVPEAVVNGAVGPERLANNINLSLPGFDTEYAAVVLDTHGVAVSTKSACAGAGGGESAVVLAATGDAARARSTLRLTLGFDTTEADIRTAVEILQKFVAQMRSLT